MIYHMAWRSDWDAGIADGVYRNPSLETEGFIHCTHEPGLLVSVANQFFAENRAEDLLIVSIDPKRVAAEIKDEDPGVCIAFPHVYGPIELDAVLGFDTMRRVSGGWRLPERFE